MQNKPNFRKAEMKLSFYSTKNYENKPRLRTLGKQTQSNPISKGTLAQSQGLLTEDRLVGFRIRTLTRRLNRRANRDCRGLRPRNDPSEILHDTSHGAGRKWIPAPSTMLGTGFAGMTPLE